MATLAEQKKAILPYLQRAEEIDSLNPKVAYYCRVYAIEQGIAIPDRLPEITDVLGAVMDKLQQDKSKLNITDEDAQYCEAFAVTVFNRADRQDRAGKAGPTTIKAFYVATIFIEILRQFGELPPDMAERQQYAAWKAADIRKALREGRVPQAGPPVTDDNLDLPEVPGASVSKGPSTSMGTIPDVPPPTVGPPSQPSSPSKQGASSTVQAPSTGPKRDRFRPGSKVFYNSFDGPPVKGTVVSTQPSQYGNLCQVGLSQKIVEVPEARLAFDFGPGDAIMYSASGKTPQKGHVERGDAAKWPIAYLISLEDGQILPTTEEALTPAESAQNPVQPFREAPGEGPAPIAPPTAPEGPSVPTTSLSQSVDTVNSDQINGNPTDRDLPPEEPASLPGAPSHFQAATTSSEPDVHVDEGPESTPSADLDSVGPPENDDQASPSRGDLAPGHQQETDTAAQMGEPSNSSYPDLGAANSDSLRSTPADGHASHPGPYPTVTDSQAADRAPMFPPGTIQGTDMHPPGHPSIPGAKFLPGQYPPAFGQGNAGFMQQAQPAPASHQPTIQAITEAQKYSKYAASSLGFEDVPTAMKYLQQAMDLLKGPG